MTPPRRARPRSSAPWRWQGRWQQPSARRNELPARRQHLHHLRARKWHGRAKKKRVLQPPRNPRQKSAALLKEPKSNRRDLLHKRSQKKNRKLSTLLRLLLNQCPQLPAHQGACRLLPPPELLRHQRKHPRPS